MGAPRFVVGTAAVLVGGLAARLGTIHLVVNSPFWLLIFAVTALAGLALLVWGGRTVLSVLPIPQISIPVDGDG